MTEQDKALEQWAKHTDFPQPIQWGELEAAILAMPKPDFDPDPHTAIGGGGRGARVVSVILQPLVWLFVAALFGSPLIGLILILIGVNAGDPEVARTWVMVAFFAFIGAAGIPVAMGLMWSEIRRRIPWMMVLTGGTGVASLIAYLVLRTVPELLGIGWLNWLIPLVAGGALVVFGLMLFASKSGAGLPRQSRKKMTREEQQYAAMRAKVLEIIIKRGLVDEDEIDVPEFVEARLGSWHMADVSER